MTTQTLDQQIALWAAEDAAFAAIDKARTAYFALITEIEAANTDTMPVRLKDGRYEAKCAADRAYLHYIIDCWLDDEPVVLQAAELE